MKADYSQYLHVTEDGEIWWPLDLAIKLTAGYLPRSGDHPLITPMLFAPNERVLANEKTILAAVHDRRNGNEVPLILRGRRDGEDGEDEEDEEDEEDAVYVTARAFLIWLSRRMPDIPLPADLVVAINYVHAEQPPLVTVKAFERLTETLSGWFDKPLSDFPPEIRMALKKQDEHLFLLWDHLDSPQCDSHNKNAENAEQSKRNAEIQRRSRTEQWDYLHDPALAAERQTHFEFFAQLLDAAHERARIEMMSATTPTETEAKNRLLADLEAKIGRLEFEMAQPRSGTANSANTALASQLPVEAVVQSSANIGSATLRSQQGKDAATVLHNRPRDSRDLSSRMEKSIDMPSKSRSRMDALGEEIEIITHDLGREASTPKMVMQKLQSCAGRTESCVVEAKKNAIVYRTAAGDQKALDTRALNARLKRHWARIQKA